MALRRCERTTAQYHLVDHELAIVLAERALCCTIARIGRVGAARPLPDETERIIDEICTRGSLPFRLARQMLACPARKGVRLVVADMGDGRLRIDRRHPAK